MQNCGGKIRLERVSLIQRRKLEMNTKMDFGK